MRIGIDLRMAGGGFGIGRYALELTDALLKKDTENKYVLIFDESFNKKLYLRYKEKGWDCVLVDAHYYSIREQLVLPKLLHSLKLDLMHFTNFNVPLLYRGKFVVTIHDLIHHKFPGRKKKNFIYRIAYREIISSAIKRADRIIAVSQTTKDDIINRFGVRSQKIEVVLEGVAPDFSTPSDPKVINSVKLRYGIEKKYLLFVGEWRQYKNVPFLVKMFLGLPLEHRQKYQLILVGGEDKHYPEIIQEIKNEIRDNSVLDLGKISDSDLKDLYAGAEWYISASLSEGFGLAYIEAQSQGTPVISSDIPVAHEVLQSSGVYFDQFDLAKATRTLAETLVSPTIRLEKSKQSTINRQRFSWDAAASATVSIYKEILTK